jgi:hypothetical protein
MLISGDTPNEFMNKVLVGLETQKISEGTAEFGGL